MKYGKRIRGMYSDKMNSELNVVIKDGAEGYVGC